jgi:hypothetical protein
VGDNYDEQEGKQEMLVDEKERKVG